MLGRTFLAAARRPLGMAIWPLNETHCIGTLSREGQRLSELLLESIHMQCHLLLHAIAFERDWNLALATCFSRHWRHLLVELKVVSGRQSPTPDPGPQQPDETATT